MCEHSFHHGIELHRRTFLLGPACKRALGSGREYIIDQVLCGVYQNLKINAAVLYMRNSLWRLLYMETESTDETEAIVLVEEATSIEELRVVRAFTVRLP